MREHNPDNNDRSRQGSAPAGHHEHTGFKMESASKRLVWRRTVFLMLVFGVVLFSMLLYRLWDISIVNHDKYQSLAVEQQTRDVTVAADRGSIYDSKGNVMAMSATVYNLILSPRDLVNSISEKKFTKDGVFDEAGYNKAIEDRRELITNEICAVLDMDREEITKRINKTDSAYEVIKKNIGGEEADQLLEFIAENKLGYSLQMVPSSKRYYPFSSMAAQVLGFCNEEGGAYGLEAWYDSDLRGAPGRVVTTKTGRGTEIYNSHSEYMDAVHGRDLHLTIDSTIQAYAEKTLEEGIKEFDVQAGGWCIVMDPKTGAIKAMASAPEYDPNHYGIVTDERLKAIMEGKRANMNLSEEDRQKAMSDALNKQWRSQAYMDTYEPGSTFKALVLAAALEENVVNENDTFNCPGYAMVPGWSHPISCSKKAPGHGHQNLTQAVQHSCNPAFIQIGSRLGVEKFYEYFYAFGLGEPTGLDLPGEANGIIWDSMSNVDLAVASFGQRLKVTPIQMITAFSSVINGGKLMKPYVVDSITTQDGTVVEKTEPTEVRQVISEQTSRRASAILEKVVSDPKDGTGKLAYKPGYRIGGKTGTSETNVPGEVVVSFMAFAPAEDPEVIILLAYNTPARSAPGSNWGTTGTYISGGNMPAKKVGDLMANILDYMGVEKKYTAEEASLADISVPSVAGYTLTDAKKRLDSKKISYQIIGEGDVVAAQLPSAGTHLPGGSSVLLYMDKAPEETGIVPDVVGLGFDAARKKLETAGFFMRASGASTYYGNASKVSSQSVPGGQSAEMGSVIDVQFTTPQIEDGMVDVD